MRSLSFLLLISALSGAAHADGAYVEGGVFAHRYDLSGAGGAISTTPGGSGKGHVVAPMLRLGYEIDDRWAVEATYYAHGSPGYRFQPATTDNRLTSHGRSWVLAGRWTQPINDRFALVARLGLAGNHSSLSGTGAAAASATSGSTTALYGSLGLETTIAPAWRLGLAWDHTGMNRDKGGQVINGISTTLRYKF